MPAYKKHNQVAYDKSAGWGDHKNTTKNSQVDTEHLQTAFLLPASALQHPTRLSCSQGSCTALKLSYWCSQPNYSWLTCARIAVSEAVPQAFCAA